MREAVACIGSSNIIQFVRPGAHLTFAFCSPNSIMAKRTTPPTLGCNWVLRCHADPPLTCSGHARWWRSSMPTTLRSTPRHGRGVRENTPHLSTHPLLTLLDVKGYARGSHRLHAGIKPPVVLASASGNHSLGRPHPHACQHSSLDEPP